MNPQLQEVNKQFSAATNDEQRRGMLMGIRICNPQLADEFEETLLRNQIRSMPNDELIRLVAQHQNCSLTQAEEMIRDGIFDTLLKKDKLTLNFNKTPSRPTVPPPPVRSLTQQVLEQPAQIKVSLEADPSVKQSPPAESEPEPIEVPADAGVFPPPERPMPTSPETSQRRHMLPRIPS